MARVAIEHLTKVFEGPRGERTRAVHDVTLSVEPGELLVLVGPSGCGKSTTLRLIAGLEQPTSGTISIDGRAMNNTPPGEREVAMVFQNYALYPHMTAYENIAFGLKVRKVPRAEADGRVREVAGLLGLTACLEREPKALSGGERQRVALARALVRRPKVLLLDEPLSNLDPQMRAQVRAELARLHKQLGMTMLYVTHDQAEAMSMGQRIAVMRAGELQQVAPPLTVYERPANVFVGQFVGAPGMNLLEGKVIGGSTGAVFQTQQANGHGQIALPLSSETASRLQGYFDKPLLFGIRPEHVHAVVANAPVSPPNAIAAVVDVVEPLGAETFLRLNHGPVSLVARVPATTRAQPQQTMTLTLDIGAAHFFDSSTGEALPNP